MRCGIVEFAIRDDRAGQAQFIADALQPLRLAQFVARRDADLDVNGRCQFEPGRIGAQIVNEVILLNGRRIAEETFDAARHQPRVVTRLEIPEVMMCIDYSAHDG